MPAPEIADLYQRAVLWTLPAGAQWDRSGRPTKGLAAPIEVPCRWTDADYETMDAFGNTITLNAKVVVGMPARVLGQSVLTVIVPQSRMWLGTLDAWNNLGGPPDNRTMEIKTVDKTPDLKARFFRFQLGLMRYSQKVGG